MAKVLIADNLSEKAEKIFIDKGLEVDVITGLDKEGLVKIINNYEAIAVRSSTKISEKF